MKIAQVNNAVYNQNFGALKIKYNNIGGGEKDAIDKFVKRQAKLEKEGLDVEGLMKAIDETSDRRNCNVEIEYELDKGKNKTRVKSAFMKIGQKQKDGSTGGGRSSQRIAPEKFIFMLKDYAMSAGVNPNKFTQKD